MTRILSAIEQSEPHAAEELLPLVYQDLRQLAAQKAAGEKPGQTLQATALVQPMSEKKSGRLGPYRQASPGGDIQHAA